MGLLDALSSDNGLLGLALLSAGSAKPVRTGLGEGLLGGLQLVQQQRAQREDREQRRLMMEMQRQQAQMALDDRKRQQDLMSRRDQFLASIDPNQGPPMEATLPGAMRSGFSPQEAAAFVPTAREPKYMVVDSNLVRVDGNAPSLAFSAPAKPEKPPTSVQEYKFAQGDPKFGAWLDRQNQGKATRVEVPINLGQKGFDNTLKLRGDFRGEPIYKAHQEMQSAYSQIQQSLKQASPAGDLAGATKIMKLLDPGSVVRESELGMAMAASGLMDRVVNYADNIVKGTKLTPTQRADFQRLADALFAESVKQYNAKRSEYQGIAERNQLNVDDVLGAPSQGPAPLGGGWSIKPKGQ